MDLRKALYRFYWRLESKMVPELKSSQYHYHEALQDALSVTSAEWLDIGCGHQVFSTWMGKEQAQVIGKAARMVGLDPSEPDLRKHSGTKLKVLGNADNLPFHAESFDVISANMVVEHLQQPEVVLQQVHRALKSGGQFVFHTPNYYNPLIWIAFRFPQGPKNLVIQFLEKRAEEDVFPTLYRMNTEQDVRAFAQAGGFRVKHLRQVSTSAATVMLGPLVILELLCIRLCRLPSLAWLRSNLVVTLEKG